VRHVLDSPCPQRPRCRSPNNRRGRCLPCFYESEESEQLSLPSRLGQSLLLVEETLHELLLLVAIREDLAHRLSDQPERVVVGVTTSIEELCHPLRITLLPECTHPVQHVDETGRRAISGGIT